MDFAAISSRAGEKRISRDVLSIHRVIRNVENVTDIIPGVPAGDHRSVILLWHISGAQKPVVAAKGEVLRVVRRVPARNTGEIEERYGGASGANAISDGGRSRQPIHHDMVCITEIG